MYIVFDIGGTFVKHALMSSDGKIINEGKFSTPNNSTDVLIDQMVEVFKSSTDQVKGIAISCPGMIDVDSGIVYHGGSLTYLHKQNLSELVRSRCGVSVSIENDGKCAALAELWLGSVKGYKHAAVLVLGTGVGGGLIIDGKLHRGSNLAAGEMSYIMDGFKLETNKATFVGLSGSAARMVDTIVKTKNLRENDGEAAFSYIVNGDEEATNVFNDYCKSIAVQILNLQYVLDPDIFAIGGGISVQPILLDGIKQAIEDIKHANPMHVATPYVVTCKFRSAANLYGALYHYLQQYEKVE
ncbi:MULTISPECIES: ROK family protein [Paraliobacillus]|uniref:ROK family protein n=1 Tax=Paraliobacillus TaxID=200903 RepID=UPI000DD350A7|nr:MULTISPECIES: ROK family protein [Paraliobacillus]